jgi:DedD protein
MDRRLRARLIGASILVLLAVIVVPEMLSGPKPREAAPPPAARIAGVAPDAMHTFTLAVPAGHGTIATPAADGEVVPAAIAPIVAKPAEGVAVIARARTIAPAAAAPALPVEAAPTVPAPIEKGAWAVQVGSFANAANAKKIMRELAEKGYAVYTVQAGHGKHLQHKVRIGPEADRAAAEQILSKLKDDGHTGAVVAP